MSRAADAFRRLVADPAAHELNPDGAAALLDLVEESMRIKEPSDDEVSRRIGNALEAIGARDVERRTLRDLREDLAQLAARWSTSAADAARLASVGDFNAFRSSTFEACAAQLREVLARPARPNADDGEE